MQIIIPGDKAGALALAQLQSKESVTLWGRAHFVVGVTVRKFEPAPISCPPEPWKPKAPAPARPKTPEYETVITLEAVDGRPA